MAYNGKRCAYACIHLRGRLAGRGPTVSCRHVLRSESHFRLVGAREYSHERCWWGEHDGVLGNAGELFTCGEQMGSSRAIFDIGFPVGNDEHVRSIAAQPSSLLPINELPLRRGGWCEWWRVCGVLPVERIDAGLIP